jgi:hypothetical protein
MSAKTTTSKSIWWLPDSPEKRLQGEVTFGPVDGAEVDLFGHIYENYDDRKLTERFTLHGHTFDMKPISLFQCMITGGTTHIPGGTSCEISCFSGITGGHYCSLDEAVFKEVRVKIKGLVEWACYSGIKPTFDQNPNKCTVSYMVPEIVQLGKYGPFSMHLEFEGVIHPDFHSFNIKEDCALVIEAHEMQPYPRFEEYVYKFQQFLCLAMQRPVYTKDIIAHTDRPKQVIQEMPIFEDYQIIRKISDETTSEEKLIPQFMMFALPELGTQPQLIFEKFIERQEKLGASMDLYLTTIYNRTQIPRVKFLTLSQSIEAYHRITNPGKFSLRERIMDVATKHSSILEPLVGAADEFASKVSSFRNQLTHPDEGNAEIYKDYRSLLRFSDQIALLLEVCYLSEIGFSQDQIKAILSSRSERARRIYEGWI